MVALAMAMIVLVMMTTEVHAQAVVASMFSTQFAGFNSLLKLDLTVPVNAADGQENHILFVTGPFEDSPLLQNLSMAGNPSVCTINSTGGMQCQCGQYDPGHHNRTATTG